MTSGPTHQKMAADIWAVADLLRGDYKRHEYGQVILPFTVLRRLDAVMAPTRDAPVVRLHPATRARHLDLLRWGLVPHWAKDPKSVRQPINARAETVGT